MSKLDRGFGPFFCLMESKFNLVEELRLGSNQAKELVFREYYEYFISIAIKIVQSKEDAEDVVSDCMNKIFNKVGQLKDPSQFLSWCRSIITRDCYNYIKARKVHSGIETYNSGYQSDYYKAFDLNLVKKEIERLSPGYRQILELHCIQGHDGLEVAKMLKIHPGTVRSQLSKARRVLQKRLHYEY